LGEPSPGTIDTLIHPRIERIPSDGAVHEGHKNDGGSFPPYPPRRLLRREPNRELAAIGASIILFTLASGTGLAAIRPWSFSNPSPTTFGVVAAIVLVTTQWLASALGGYLTGRLRTKWVGIRTDEVFFGDTARGFLAWALATVIMAIIFSVGFATVAVTSGATDVTVTAEAAEQARKAAANFSLLTSLSFLIGAFIASVGGALGGFHRDED
jgi:hypothetical protein